MRDKYFEKVPEFDGVSAASIKDYIDKYWDHMEAYGVINEDVFMRGLPHSLEGEV